MSDTQAASTALAIIPRSLDDVHALAKSIAGSVMLPSELKREPDIIMAVISGAELGLPPMASIRGVNIIKGKPSLTAATMMAVVLGRGLAEYFECEIDTPTSVTYETKRRNGKKVQRATFTVDDAKRARLGGDNWEKYTSDMLHARAISRLARRVYPDLLAGYYTPEEIEHFDDAIEAEFVDVPSSFAPLPKTDPTPTPTVANEERPTPEPTPTTASAGPLTDDDVANIADEMKTAATNKDAKELSSIAADVSKLNINKAQREYLLGVYRKSSDAIKAAA